MILIFSLVKRIMFCDPQGRPLETKVTFTVYVCVSVCQHACLTYGQTPPRYVIISQILILSIAETYPQQVSCILYVKMWNTLIPNTTPEHRSFLLGAILLKQLPNKGALANFWNLPFNMNFLCSGSTATPSGKINHWDPPCWFNLKCILISEGFHAVI